MRRLTACCLLASIAALPVWAADALDEGAGRTVAGLTALEAGDMATARSQLELGARAGNRLAAYELAMLLFSDPAGVPDEQAAWRWLRRAVTAGLAEAQFAFAQLYDRGHQVPRSPATALHFYRLAAEQGLVDAQVSLGTLYFVGQDVRQDYAEAARWYLAAAEGGHAGAQYLIAHMFEEGYGVHRDLDQARRWYGEAARQGDPLAASRLQALNSPGD